MTKVARPEGDFQVSHRGQATSWAGAEAGQGLPVLDSPGPLRQGCLLNRPCAVPMQP